MALEPLNGLFGCSAVGHLHKAKAPGATGVTVSNNIDLIHHTIRLEELAKVMISGTKSKVTYKDIHAEILFIVKNVDMIDRSSEQYAEAQDARAIRRRNGERA
jgi:predicted regulator of Ras-like GTPase activity (Roadblock/LC7/MglB family)